MTTGTSGYRRQFLALNPRMLFASALLVISSADRASAAGIIVDSRGFEPPLYSTGALAGKGAFPGQGPWLTSQVGDPNSTATVHAGTVAAGTVPPAGGGSQAVTVTRGTTAGSDRYWAVPSVGFPTQRFVIVDWDMAYTSSTAGSGQFGPFFGVDSYDADGNVTGDPAPDPLVLGTLGVDAKSGEILYRQQNSGVILAAAVTVDPGVWYHYRLVLDFATDKYFGFVGGSHILTTGFADGNFGLNNFTDADIATFSVQPDSQGVGGSARFDNFLVRDGQAGDYDLDGDVDNADHNVFRSTFGNSVTSGNGADGSRNGIIDAADYVIWRENLGQNIFQGMAGVGAVLQGGVVPEPSSMLLLLIAAFAWLAAARRR